MYRSIVVPLDGFPASEPVVPVAARLAYRSGALLHLAHVVDLLSFPPYSKGCSKAEWFNGRAVTLAADYMNRMAAWAREDCPDLEVSTTTLQEPTAPSLVEYAARVEADLMVMMTHGRTPYKRFWLGSVADQIARTAPCPVLFLRLKHARNSARLPKHFRKILVPLDGSAWSEAAVPVAQALGEIDNAEITLLTVLHPARVPVPALAVAAGADSTGAVIETCKDAAREYLAHVADALSTPDSKPQTAWIKGSGSAGPAILEYAKKHSFDVIALSTHGQGGIRRLMLGSVADKVLRGAKMPVLVFHPDEDA
jgi:nucleotide-binding universal stress UspA family protein